MATRDLTEAQFRARLKKHGMSDRGAKLGYVEVAPQWLVHPLNGGPTRREQLAYLLRRQAEIRTEMANR